MDPEQKPEEPSPDSEFDSFLADIPDNHQQAQDDLTNLLAESPELQTPVEAAAPTEKPPQDLVSGFVKGIKKSPKALIDTLSYPGKLAADERIPMSPGGSPLQRVALGIMNDLEKRFSGQSAAQTAADVGGAATMISPPVGLLAAPVLRILADSSDESRGLTPPTSTGEKLGKGGEMLGTGIGSSMLTALPGMAVGGITKIKAGRADAKINPEIEAANTKAATDHAYAQTPNAIPNQLGRPSTGVPAERVLVEQIRHAEPVMDSTNITRVSPNAKFDPDTLTFVDEPGAKPAGTLNEVADVMKKNTPLILETKAKVLTAFDKERAMLNKEANPELKVEPVKYTDLNLPQDVGLGDSKPTGKGSTPTVEGGQTLETELFRRLRNDFEVKGGGMTINQISQKIQDTQKELRALGEYDPANQGATYAGKPLGADEHAAMISAQTQIQAALKDALKSKMDDIWQKAASTERPNSEFFNTVKSIDRAQQLNDVVHNLIPMEREFRRFSELNSKQTATNFPTPRAGFREDNIPTNFVQPAGTIPLTPKGVIGKIGGSLLQRFMKPDVPDTVDQNVNLRNQMMTRENQALPEINRILSAREAPAPESLPLQNTAGNVQVPTPMQMTGSGVPVPRPNAVGVAVANRLGAKLSPKGVFPQPEPEKFDRDAGKLVSNQDAFLQRVAQTAGMGVAAQAEQILNGRLPPTEKSRALGLLAAHIPPLQDVFKPGKSGAPSEFGGQIHSEEDMSNLASEIENSPKLDMKEKALAWTTLWKDKKFSPVGSLRKGLYGE